MAFAARACQCGTVDCARYSKAAKIFPLTNRAERTAGKWDPASPAPGLGSCTPSLPVQKGGSLPTDRKQSGACPRYRSNVGWRLHSPRPRGAVANGGSWGGCVDNAGSCGGVVTSGLAIYDTMQFVRPAVSTLCVGQAASMASLLLAAGQKDMRFALPNSRIMLHQPSGGFQGQATDIMLHAQEILNLKKRLNEIYVKHTGQPLKKIEDALERDYFLTGEMAMEWGIVDKVINKRPEDPAALKVV